MAGVRGGMVGVDVGVMGGCGTMGGVLGGYDVRGVYLGGGCVLWACGSGVEVVVGLVWGVGGGVWVF